MSISDFINSHANSSKLMPLYEKKPAAAKGQYIRSCVVTATMGPGVKINPNKVGSAAAEVK